MILQVQGFRKGTCTLFNLLADDFLMRQYQTGGFTLMFRQHSSRKSVSARWPQALCLLSAKNMEKAAAAFSNFTSIRREWCKFAGKPARATYRTSNKLVQVTVCCIMSSIENIWKFCGNIWKLFGNNIIKLKG